MKDVTFIVKSFERPHCLERLIRSARWKYPDVRIIVADDSRESPPPSRHYELVRLPFDVGLSAGRNAALGLVTTPFFLLLDDDFEFVKQTDVERMLEIAKRGYDVVGGGVIEKGVVRHYEGNLTTETDPASGTTTLRYLREYYRKEPDHFSCDMVMNFFVGRTEAVRAIGWDPVLKVAEHTDFFWRGKAKGLKVAYCPDAQILHLREREGEYRKYRLRAKKLFRTFLKKNGFARSVNFDGVVYEA